MKTPDNYCSILYRICQEEGIELKFFSRNWGKRLRKDGQICYILGVKFDLNPAAATLIADDKYALYETLCLANVPVIEHRILYEGDNNAAHVMGSNTIQYIMEFFEQNNQDIVIKANNGTGGDEVFRVTCPDQIPAILLKVFHQCYSASLCPFCQIKHEYRVVLLDGEEQLAYRKTLPEGDENWKFNLHQGAKSDQIPEEQHAEILSLAQRAAKAVGLRFCSVDIIEDQNGDFYVMELNSGVMISRYVDQHPEEAERVVEIYRAAIRRMFES